MADREVSGAISAVGTISGNLSALGNIGGVVAAYQPPEYDGDYNITPTETEQTLQTAGKKLLENVVVTAIPSRYADVTNTTALATDVKSGKAFRLADGSASVGSYAWNWMGDVAEKIADVYSASYSLASTTFASWTPSTTAKAIKATANAYTFAADMAHYEYLIRWRCQFRAAYNVGATLKAQEETEIAEIWQALYRRPNSVANIASENFNGNTCMTLQTVPLNVYYNTSGVKTYTWSVSYGIYPSATAATFSSSTSDTPTVTVKTPAYNARCSSTYFATARAPELDQANSMIHIVGELYRVPVGSTARSMYANLVDLYNNPLE